MIPCSWPKLLIKLNHPHLYHFLDTSLVQPHSSSPNFCRELYMATHSEHFLPIRIWIVGGRSLHLLMLPILSCPISYLFLGSQILIQHNVNAFSFNWSENKIYALLPISHQQGFIQTSHWLTAILFLWLTQVWLPLTLLLLVGTPVIIPHNSLILPQNMVISHHTAPQIVIKSNATLWK